jgi:hypothetical protein
MGRHHGKFRWKKYTKYKGNLRDYWTRSDRKGDRHRRDDDDRSVDNTGDPQVSP